ncbi:MAG: hypothetical protein HUU50_07490 [Candidatus Brocadiae bacterium]|nr:hypothetical protein [Candidatus Brocadiia bacterium]
MKSTVFCLFLFAMIVSLFGQDFPNLFQEEKILPIEKYDADIFFKNLPQNMAKEQGLETAQIQIEEILVQCIRKNLYKVQIYILFHYGRILCENGKPQLGFPYLKKALDRMDHVFSSEDLKKEEILPSVYQAIFQYTKSVSVSLEKTHKWLLYLRDVKPKYLSWTLIREDLLLSLSEISYRLAEQSQNAYTKLNFFKESKASCRDFINYYPESKEVEKIRQREKEIVQALEAKAQEAIQRFRKEQNISAGQEALLALQILQESELKEEQQQQYQQIQRQVKEWHLAQHTKKAWTGTIASLAVIILVFLFTLRKPSVPSDLREEIAWMHNDPIGMFFEKSRLSIFSVFAFFFILDAIVVVVWALINRSFSPYIPQSESGFWQPIVLFINQFSCDRNIMTFAEDFAGRTNYLLNAPLGSTLIYYFYRMLQKHYNLIRAGFIYQGMEQPEKSEHLERFYRLFVSAWLPIFAMLIALALSHFIAIRKVGLWNSLSEGWIGWYTRYFHSIITYYVFALFIIKLLLSVTWQFRQRSCPLVLHPVHHDGCAGMATFGKVSLASNFIICLLGVFLAVNIGRNTIMEWDSPVTWFGIIAYISLAPFLFFYPFINIHYKLNQSRSQELNYLQVYLQKYYAQFRILLFEPTAQAQTISNEQTLQMVLEQFNYINDFYQKLIKMPTWAINTNAMVQFIISYLIPISIFIAKYILDINI